MHAEVNRHTRMRDPEVPEKRAILLRFFSKAFPEPKYKRARVPTDFTPYDHGLEIFRDGKKVHVVYISSDTMNDRHPTPKELKELLGSMNIAKQITQAETFRIDHAALGTGRAR